MAAFDTLLDDFHDAIGECRELYVESGRLCAFQHPELISGEPQQFVRLMDDLHRGLLLKTFVMVGEADRRWSKAEKRLAQELFLHVWGRLLDGTELQQTMANVSEQVLRLQWYTLVRPFACFSPLRDRVGRLETILVRFANLVAKADGPIVQRESNILHKLQAELDTHLRRIPMDDSPRHVARQIGARAAEQLPDEVAQMRKQCRLSESPPPLPAVENRAAGQSCLADLMQQLEQLIGIENVKREIQTLANFIQFQKQRERAGLPQTMPSLHMVFTGNPGTGKTTVARIVGQILGALGVLAKGQVIETDRSGMVAEYAGQTAPRTNRRVDEALDGILFIDEAYTLCAESGDDAYGQEAIQTLLKRMEDDRHRLVVILAGYPQPMARLLDSNPGLASRFSRRIHFPDYEPIDLGRIFEQMCRVNHYELPGSTRARFLCGATWRFEHRTEHFGNGRMARNVFEDAIRCLANRIADTSPVTRELLTRLEPSDIQMDDVPGELWERCDQARFEVSCPGCGRTSQVKHDLLGQRVKCGCGHRFNTDWGRWLRDEHSA